MSITAVLSTFNNEVTISNVVLQTLAHADRVIVVDDGSTDGTAEKARLAGAEVIRHNINMGKEAALRTGFALAAQNGAKVIVTMDSDGRHDPGDIRKLAEPILCGEADLVKGSYNGYGGNITDTQIDFRAFSRKCFNYLITEGNVINSIKENGLKVIEVQIGSNGSKAQQSSGTTRKFTITAILPAFNEEVSIGSMVLHARQHADHVVVIDDGSKDRTSEMAKLAGAEVIRHPENMGKGMALRTGFEHAGKNGCKVVITMDTDGQHDPDDIQKLISPILNGEADIVNGSRYMNGTDKNTPFYRRIGQNILDRATNLNAGLKITDTQSGFRAFARHTLTAFRFKSNGLAIESEMLMDAANAGFRIKEVEIGVRYDVDCSSENPIKHGLKVLANVINDMELNRPLYYFTLPGAILGMIGLAMGLSFLQKFYNGGGLMFGPTLLMILFTLIGTFMTFTGIILHTMSKLINENKKKVNISSNPDPDAGLTVKRDPFNNPWNPS